MATPELWLKPAQIETVSRRHEPRLKTDSLTRDNREKTRPAQARLRKKHTLGCESGSAAKVETGKTSPFHCLKMDALSVSFRLHVNEREINAFCVSEARSHSSYNGYVSV